MDRPSAECVFDHCGLGALSDLDSPEWHNIFEVLERDQAEFLAKDRLFRRPGLWWPRDPLHTWSRVWEYPYVYYHLRYIRQSLPDDTSVRVVDYGSGCTFLPFSVGRLGFHITCIDVDPAIVESVNNATELVDTAPGRVNAVLAGAEGTPLEDGEAQIVYCVSVLEHTGDPVREIVEIARILRPGGTLILTVDLDLQGNLGLGIEARTRLIRAITKMFKWGRPCRTVHPADLLTSNRGPFPFREPEGLAAAKFRLRQLAKALLGRKRLLRPTWLAVEGMVLRKPTRC